MHCPECGSTMKLEVEAHTEVTPTAYEKWWECSYCGTCVAYGIGDEDDDYEVYGFETQEFD